MVPPQDFFGILPAWAGVYAGLLITVILSSLLLHKRVFWLISQGKSTARFDQPWRRLTGAISIVFGQRKVLQRVGSIDPRSRKIDLAGLGHASIFWGFMSFTASYALFIFGDSIWPELSKTILTTTGVMIFSAYLDIFAAIILVALGWGLTRRWLVKPHRLSFDLTRNIDAVIVVALTAALMVVTLLVHSL